jgi:hypothetical protein
MEARVRSGRKLNRPTRAARRLGSGARARGATQASARRGKHKSQGDTLEASGGCDGARRANRVDQKPIVRGLLTKAPSRPAVPARESWCPPPKRQRVLPFMVGPSAIAVSVTPLAPPFFAN